jgi:hypothetical protein
MRSRSMLAGILIIAGFAAAAAQTATKNAHTCTLLTSAEVVAAVGGSGQAQETSTVLKSGPAKGETMGGCMWAADNQGMVNISTIRAAQGAQREAGLAGIRAAFATLRTKGWTEETKAFPDARCSLMTPPPGQQTAAVMTGCMAEVGGMAISVGYMGKQRVPIETVKALLDKAAGRLR